jgi:predicted cupin superfamily sugar epimerase
VLCKTYLYGGDRPAACPRASAPPFATAIYFLLAGGARSRLHRIRSDEVWHFYDGARRASR